MKKEKVVLTLGLFDRHGRELNTVGAIGYERVVIKHLGQKIIFPMAINTWEEVMYGYLFSSQVPGHAIFQMCINPDARPVYVPCGGTLSCKLKLPQGLAKALRSGKGLIRRRDVSTRNSGHGSSDCDQSQT